MIFALLPCLHVKSAQASVRNRENPTLTCFSLLERRAKNININLFASVYFASWFWHSHWLLLFTYAQRSGRGYCNKKGLLRLFGVSRLRVSPILAIALIMFYRRMSPEQFSLVRIIIIFQIVTERRAHRRHRRGIVPEKKDERDQMKAFMSETSVNRSMKMKVV